MKRNVGILLSLLLIVIGIAGAVNIVMNGEAVMGTSNEVPWGILISGYEYFVGISTGLLLVAAVGYVFNFAPIKSIGKTLVMLSLFTMLSAFAVLLIELGNPINMYQYFLSPNPMSSLWWMAPLYSTYLVLLLSLLYFILIKDDKKTRVLAGITAISALLALMNIGFLFGFLNARPYWNGPFSTVYFVVTAFFSGIALAGIAVHFLSKRTEVSSLTIVAIRKFYIASISVVSLMVAAKIITGLYGAASGKADAIMAFISGPLSFQFWTFEVLVGLAIPLAILLWAKGTYSLAIAGLMSLFGILFMRIDMVIAGQINPLKIVYGGTKEVVYHTYTALWSEWALIIGAVGITLFLYLFQDKFEGTVKTVLKKSEKTAA